MQKQMKIHNIFRLSNGETMLCGDIINSPAFIKTCRAELTTGNQTRQILLISTEQILKKINTENTMRVVATKDEVNLSEAEAQSGLWSLIFDLP